MSGQKIEFRASPQFRERLEEIAAERGQSLSAAIKSAVLESARPADGDPVPDEDEVLALLGQAARAGSVSAMKELRAYHREHSDESEDLSGIDELAQRRTA